MSSSAESKLRLKVAPNFSGVATVNVPFRVDLFLLNSDERLKCGMEYPLQLQLHYDESPTRACPDGLAVIQTPQSNVRISKEGICTVMIKLTQLSMAHENKKFRLHIMAQPHGILRGSKGEVGDHEPEIIQVLSPPIFVARHRLVLRKEIDIPDVWFKDQAGKDKAIEIIADLVDFKNRLVFNRQVKLKVACLYEDERPVPAAKDILTVTGDSHILETGSASLRVRINDVSKNHQRQRFRLFIGPDTGESPLDADIAPITTAPITVKSKCRREREAQLLLRKDNDEEYKYASNSSFLRLGEYSLSSLLSGVGSDPQNIYQNGANSCHPSSIQSMHQMDSMNAFHLPLSSISKSFELAAEPQIYDAAQQVIDWTKNVVDGLANLQWKHMGYEISPDGSPDLSKPLYAMSNPNEIISKLLKDYQSSTKQNLTYLASTERGDRKRQASDDLESRETYHVPKDRKCMKSTLIFNEQEDNGYTSSEDGSDRTLDEKSIHEALEAEVHYILAVRTDFGFPAFNIYKTLIGYYQETWNEETFITTMNFIAIGECEVPPTSLDMSQASMLLQERIDRQDKDLYSISNGYLNDLAKMKDDVIVYYWQHDI